METLAFLTLLSPVPSLFLLGDELSSVIICSGAEWLKSEQRLWAKRRGGPQKLLFETDQQD